MLSLLSSSSTTRAGRSRPESACVAQPVLAASANAITLAIRFMAITPEMIVKPGRGEFTDGRCH
jgi:hypothetical protein